MVKIKPLEWVNVAPDDGKSPAYWIADSIVGLFIVADGFWRLEMRAKSTANLQTRDDDTAKASAQAKYEIMIRNVLDY